MLFGLLSRPLTAVKASLRHTPLKLHRWTSFPPTTQTTFAPSVGDFLHQQQPQQGASSQQSKHQRTAHPLLSTATLAFITGEFLVALKDVRTQEAGELLRHIRAASSLQDLWHLRADLYRLVAVHYNEYEAQARVARLNRHFPWQIVASKR